MATQASCPKCGGEMDEGKLWDNIPYFSNNSPTGFLSNAGSVSVVRAKACLTCGYLELYVDPQELAKRRRVG